MNTTTNITIPVNLLMRSLDLSETLPPLSELFQQLKQGGITVLAASSGRNTVRLKHSDGKSIYIDIADCNDLNFLKDKLTSIDKASLLKKFCPVLYKAWLVAFEVKLEFSLLNYEEAIKTELEKIENAYDYIEFSSKMMDAIENNKFEEAGEIGSKIKYNFAQTKIEVEKIFTRFSNIVLEDFLNEIEESGK